MRAICPAYLTPISFNHSNDVTDLKVLRFKYVLKFLRRVRIGTLQNFLDCQWNVKIKIKESRNRSGRFQWHSANEVGEVVSLTHRPPLPPGDVPGTHFQQGLSRPQGHGTVGRNMSLKNPVIRQGIDPGTVRLVAQRLNHYANPGPTLSVRT
jgi:hypothetical protein